MNYLFTPLKLFDRIDKCRGLLQILTCGLVDEGDFRNHSPTFLHPPLLIEEVGVLFREDEYRDDAEDHKRGNEQEVE